MLLFVKLAFKPYFVKSFEGNLFLFIYFIYFIFLNLLIWLSHYLTLILTNLGMATDKGGTRKFSFWRGHYIKKKKF